MNTELRKKTKSDFDKDFFKTMNNSVFGKTMENVWKYRDIKFIATKKRTTYFMWEPNYYTAMFFIETLFAIEMTKTQILMNNPVYLGLSILDLSKTVMYHFWYDYERPKYEKKEKVCYMDTDRFIVT